MTGCITWIGLRTGGRGRSLTGIKGVNMIKRLWQWIKSLSRESSQTVSGEHHGGSGTIRYGGGRQIGSGGSLRGGRYDGR